MKKRLSALLIAAMLISLISFTGGTTTRAETEQVMAGNTNTLKEPSFSHSGGFYTEAFDLKLSSEEEGVRIYYTMDGSDPVPGGEFTSEYTQSIRIKSRTGDPNILSMISNISTDSWTPWKEPNGEVFKCSTVKALAVRSDGTKSKIVTNSYFVDPNMKTKYNLPVISLVTDKSNLFDDTKGIYVNENFEEKGDEWERPAHIEFFEKDGSLAFSQYSGMRINGGYTRKVPQKSFRLYADHGYDDTGKYKYEIFPGLKKQWNGKKLDSFTRLILRDGGSDSGWSGTFFRDALLQELISHLNLCTQAYRPSVVFLDGEFWGIYNIRERYDGEYLQSHFNFDKDRAVILELWDYPSVQTGETGDEKLYTDDVINYLQTNSITMQDTYDYIKAKIDIVNYIQYNVAEIYSGNYDWPGNNTAIWKYKTSDGKYHSDAPVGQDGRWRWLLKDTDFGFGLYNKSVDFDTLSYATADVPEEGDYSYANQPWAVFLLKTLLKNDEFRNQFVNCFADQLNTSFDPRRVNQKIDEFKSGIEAVIPEHTDRWRVNMTDWENNVQDLKSYADKRPYYVRQHIINKFKDEGVEGTSEIKLNANTKEGYIRINSIDIKSTTPGVTSPDTWSGIYFKGVPVTVKAVAETGYKFDHWDGVAEAQSASDSITFNPSEDMNITAVFKADNGSATYSISGYVSPDISSDSADSKAGFKVEVLGKGISTVTDQNGFFELTNVPESSAGYSMGISKPNCLYREIRNIAVSRDRSISLQSDPIVMWPGDIIIDGVQDNCINMMDVMQIAKSFNTSRGDEMYNLFADMNEDKAVNMVDVIALAKHYNKNSSDYI